MRKTAALGIGILFVLIFAGLAYAAETSITNIETSGQSVTVGGQKYFTGDVTLKYKAANENGIASASLTLCGKNAGSETFSGDAEVQGQFNINENFLKANEPENRKYTGVIKVKDSDGNVKEADVAFYADVSTPTLSISGASDGASYKSSVTVSIKMGDGHLTGDEVFIEIKKDGTQIEKKTDIESCQNYSKTLSDEGVYTVEAGITDKGGHSKQSGLSFIIDKTPPVLTDISLSGTKREGKSWYCSAVTSTATATESLSGIDSVKVLVDGKLIRTFTSAGECQCEITKDWLASNDTSSGKHVVKYVAVDKAGNSADSETSFFADVVAPDLSYSGIDDGAFTNKPPAVTAEASDKHKDETTVYMDVYKGGSKIDSLSGGNGECKFKPQDDGKYRLSSYAEDPAGNRSDVKEITFTLDRVAPQISMHAFEGHKKDGFTWFDTSMSSTADAKDDLSGLDSVEMYVNGKSVKTISPSGSLSDQITESFDRSWFIENESEDGSYTVRIVAKDRAGNVSETEKKAYADVKTPSVSLTGIEEGKHTRKTPRLDVKVTDNYPSKNTIYIIISRDGKKIKTFERPGESTYTKAFKKDGNYVVRAYSVDKAGNKSKVQKLTFVKDTIAPALSLSGAKKNAYYSSARTIGAHVKERNYKTVSVTSSVKMVVDGKTSTPSFGKIVPTSRDYVQKKKFKKTGTYTIVLRAVDKAGNKAKPVSLTFTVDTIKPEITISGADGIKGYDSLCAPKTKVTDSYYDTSKVTLTRASGASIKGLSYKDGKIKDGGTRNYSDFKKTKKYDDIYTLTVTARDKAGNTSRLSKTFTLCRFGSRFTAAPKEMNGAYVKNVDTDITIAERTPASLKERKGILSLDGREQEANTKTSEAKLDGWNRYFYTFAKEDFADEGVYTLDTSSVDTAGNTSQFSESKNFTLYVDRTAPVISLTGIQPKSQYKLKEAKGRVSVTDNIKASSFIVKSNDRIIFISEGKSFKPDADVQLPAGINQKITITAKDAAGNIGEYEMDGVTVSDNLLLRLFANKAFDIGFGAVIAAIAAAILLLAKRRRKDEEEA